MLPVVWVPFGLSYCVVVLFRVVGFAFFVLYVKLKAGLSSDSGAFGASAG